MDVVGGELDAISMSDETERSNKNDIDAGTRRPRGLSETEQEEEDEVRDRNWKNKRNESG